MPPLHEDPYDVSMSLISPDSGFEDEQSNGKTEMGSCGAFGVVINVIVGTGFFAVPYTFYHSGLPLSIGLTLISAVFAILCAIWVLENVARARGLDTARKYGIRHTSDLNQFTFRQIEYSESSKIFSGKVGEWFCHIVFLFYAVGSLWAYVSMFSSTSANLIMKYIVQDPEDCIIELNPSSLCFFSYCISTIVLAVIVLILELFDMGKMAFIQTFFTIYRFVAFGLIFVSCIVSLVYNGSPWLNPPESTLSDPHLHPKWYSVEMSGFPGLFSSVSFAFTCSYNLPNILTPMKRGKKAAAKATVLAITSSAVIYIALAVLLPMALGGDVLQYVILNWARYGRRGFTPLTSDDAALHGVQPVETNWISQIVKFGVMLFPMLNMISTYPLVAGSIGYSFYSALPKSLQVKCGRFGPLLFRYIVTVPPFVLGLIMPSLGIIVKFCGLSAIFLVIFIPAVFHMYSKRVCKEEWRTPYSGWWSHNIFAIFAILYGAFALVYGIIRFIIDLL